MTPPFKHHPVDSLSRDALAAQGLRYTLVDTDDRDAFGAWKQAGWRGFHGPTPTADELDHQLPGVAYRRTTGVYDDGIADPHVPVATLDSWIADLSVPGGGTLPAWAISSVTVSPTHRRRGIARALLEGELRTAVALGIPMATLTVSEATIYGRFGFAPAAPAADWTFDTRRVKWTGPTATGRVEFISLERWRSEVEPLHESWRASSPGEIDVWPLRWDQKIGADGHPDVAKPLRAVRHVGASGQTEGLALYRLIEGSGEFTDHTLRVEYLLTTTPDAHAALWRFLLETDLVSSVVAPLRPIDDPVRWMISDFRAAKVETYDHLWLRVLHVPAVLAARTLGGAPMTLDVTDPLGFAAGEYPIPSVEPVESQPASTPRATLTVDALSALYAGGTTARTLAAAGLVEGDVDALDAALATPAPPWLSVWF